MPESPSNLVPIPDPGTGPRVLLLPVTFAFSRRDLEAGLHGFVEISRLEYYVDLSGAQGDFEAGGPDCGL
jgi:hypothetical protein